MIKTGRQRDSMENEAEASVWQKLQAGKNGTSVDLLNAPWGTYPPTFIQKLIILLTHKTILQRGALRKAMTKVIMSLSRPLDISFRGCNYRIEGRDNLIERGILTRPKYNDLEISFLEEPLRNGGVAIDIGCNIGLYALPLAKSAGPNGTVLAIDANPRMIELLEFNSRASGLENIVGLSVAVGSVEARADLEIRKGDSAIVRVQESDTGAIEMKPLISIVKDAGIQRVDSLKIDIEGHEDAALVPYLQTCPEELLPSRIVIERAAKTHDYPGCAAEFERLGFRLVGQTKNNSMYQR